MGRVRVGGVPPAGTLCRSARCGSRGGRGVATMLIASRPRPRWRRAARPRAPTGPHGGRGVVVGAVAQKIGDGSGDGAALGGGAHAGTGSAFTRLRVRHRHERPEIRRLGRSPIDAEEPQSRPYERALPATTSPRSSMIVPDLRSPGSPTSPEPRAWRVLPRDPTDNRRPRLAALSDSITSPIFSRSVRRSPSRAWALASASSCRMSRSRLTH